MRSDDEELSASPFIIAAAFVLFSLVQSIEYKCDAYGYTHSYYIGCEPITIGHALLMWLRTESSSDFWIAVFTFVLTFTTIALWRESQKAGTTALVSAEAAKKAAEVAEATLEGQLRPWLRLDVSVETIIVGPELVGVNVVPKIRNIGKSAATHVGFGLFYLKETTPDIRALALSKIGPLGGSVTIFEGESWEILAAGFNFSIDEEGMRGKGALDFIAWACYRFTFGDKERLHLSATKLLAITKTGTTGSGVDFVNPQTQGVMGQTEAVLMAVGQSYMD